MNLEPSTYFDLKDYSHKALFANCVYVWEALRNIKTYLSQYDLGKIEVDIPSGAYLINPELISIGKGTVVEPGAYIRGPCIIGENCTIRHGAYIRGDVITGNGCVIGHTTEVKHVILLNRAHAAHFNYLGDSILGNDVNLGAGTKCANLRLDDKQVVVRFNGQKIATGLRKFGAIIGDGCQIGCNVVCNPGSIIGQRVMCSPCLNIGGIIPSHAVINSSRTGS